MYRLCSVADTQTLIKTGLVSPPARADARWFAVAYFGLDMLIGFECGFLLPGRGEFLPEAYYSDQTEAGQFITFVCVALSHCQQGRLIETLMAPKTDLNQTELPVSQFSTHEQDLAVSQSTK